MPQNEQVPITLEEAFRTANGPAVRSGMYTEDVQNNIKREIRDRCLAIEIQWRRTQPYCATGSSSFAEYCHSCSAKVELTAAACAKNVARWTKREALDVGIMPPHYSPRLTLIVI